MRSLPQARTLPGLSGTIPAGNIANGSISGSQLAAGAAVSNLNASGQAGVPSGGIVLSATDNNTALLNAGYVKIGTTELNDVWQQRLGDSAPTARYLHTAVWTGSEMIVWGGYNGSSYFNDGGRYNPAANSWTAVTTTGAPAARASTHGGVDGQRDDRLGRAYSNGSLLERRWALQSGGQQLDGGDAPPARPPRASITRRCGRAAR